MGPECFRLRHSSGDMYSFFQEQRGKYIAYRCNATASADTSFFLYLIYFCVPLLPITSKSRQAISVQRYYIEFLINKQYYKNIINKSTAKQILFSNLGISRYHRTGCPGLNHSTDFWLAIFSAAVTFTTEYLLFIADRSVLRCTFTSIPYKTKKKSRPCLFTAIEKGS